MSDHRIKRSFIDRSEVSEEEATECQEQKGKELCDDFVWQEDLEEETGDKLPVQFSSSDITQCCQQVIVHVVDGVSVDTLRDINMGKMYFEIPLTRDFHLLLAERFNSAWSLESRLKMIDQLRSELSNRFDEDICKNELNQRIQEVIPDARRICSVDSIFLNDDTVIMQDDDSPFSVEISLRFDANVEGV